MRRESPWFIKDESIVIPSIFPVGSGGVSLQDIRAYYLCNEPEEERHYTSEPWYIPSPTPDQSLGLCEICRHINIASLMTNKTQEFHGPILFLRNILATRETCLFCELIVEALRLAGGEERGIQDLEEQDIQLCWLRSFETAIEQKRPDICSLVVVRGAIDQQYGPNSTLDNKGFIGEVRDSHGLPYRRRMGSSLYVDLLRSWIARCEKEHDDKRIVNGPRPIDTYAGRLPALRLIDTENDCIVTGGWDTRYVALSYVWGGVEQLQATLANENELSSKGILRDLRALIPRTIRDAMHLIKKMGERYLWVDALCIIQDHPEKNLLLYSMDQVYMRAAWCLAAASATHADCPLPRLGNEHNLTHKLKSFSTHIQGLELATVLPNFSTDLARCTWSTRGWVYQEEVLASRLIFLLDTQAHFVCNHAYGYREDFDVDIDKPEEIELRRRRIFAGQWKQVNFETYVRAAKDFSSRQISFPADAIKAFGGILALLQPTFRCKFLHGLPDTELDQSLLWRPREDVSRRKDSNGNHLFPSWSWAGWAGEVDYLPTLVLSRIYWKDAKTGQYFTSNQFRQGSSDGPASKWFEEKWVTGQWKKSLTFYSNVECWTDKDHHTSLFLHPVSNISERQYQLTHLASDQRALRFKCIAAVFLITGEHISAPQAHLPPRSTYSRCANGDHTTCMLKVFTISGILAGSVLVSRQYLPDIDNGSGLYEFLVLSRTRMFGEPTPIQEMKPFDDDFDDLSIFNDADESRKAKFYASGSETIWKRTELKYDTKVFDVYKPWCLYNVMLVKTTNGISERVGLGQVHIEAVLRGEHVWKDVILV
ncbi:HET-domain-containing protein [Sporormia fimetaria CBS 119925]|uniref:HET-domain-containing protein n=1 Tax=Sporormia fimetaria CBS 119925 TaxID=1340428 RepID=A0A6A6V565_9PLEO|nr:HET-domain-containing protein [Sporormia fimetaria CBS 119925]